MALTEQDIETWLRTKLAGHMGKKLQDAGFLDRDLEADRILLSSSVEDTQTGVGHRRVTSITVSTLAAILFAGVQAGEINGPPINRQEIIDWLQRDKVVGPWIAAHLP